MEGGKKVQSNNLLVEKNINFRNHVNEIRDASTNMHRIGELNYQILLSVIKYPSAVLLKKIVVPCIL